MTKSASSDKLLYIGSNEELVDTAIKAAEQSQWQPIKTSSAVEGLRLGIVNHPRIVIAELPLVDAVWTEFVESLRVFSPATHFVAIESSNSCLSTLRAEDNTDESLKAADAVIYADDGLEAAQNLEKTILRLVAGLESGELPALKVDLGNSLELACADVAVQDAPVATVVQHPEPFADSDDSYVELQNAYKKLENENKRLSEQVLLAGNLATLGAQMADIAHQLNEHINVVVGFAELLKDKQLYDQEVPRAIEAIFEAAKNASQSVRRVLSVASQHPSDNYECTELEPLLEQVAEWRCPSASFKNITIKVDAHKAPKYLHCDDLQIKLMLINLLMNAETAINIKHSALQSAALLGDDPAAKLEADSFKGEIVITAESLGKDRLRVTVADNGCGASAELLGTKEQPGLMFQPLFTTAKDSKKRLGLGLTICSSIARSHNGNLYTVASPSGGVATVFELPINCTAGKDGEANSSGSIKPTCTHHILVVEDDPLGARLSRQFLLRCGFGVSVAVDSNEALSKLEAHNFDAIVCDYNLPTMNGRELYYEILRQRPHLADRFIFVTGFMLDGEVRSFFQNCGCSYLMKPFSQFEMLQAINKCLEDKI